MDAGDLGGMRDRLHGGHPPRPDVWTGRATHRAQWPPALIGAARLALLGVHLAVDPAWESGAAALAMAVVGCVPAGLPVLFGTLASVHVALRVDRQCLDVRWVHLGVPRRRIPLSHVAGAEFVPVVTQRHWGGRGCRR